MSAVGPTMAERFLAAMDTHLDGPEGLTLTWPYRVRALRDLSHQPHLLPFALLALAEALTEPPTSESICESDGPIEGWAPLGECRHCDRNRAMALERVKRHREERRGG